ncbi:LUD domain-containing protein [Sphingobacterium corticis]|uniref:LUD domain-containing protein n=1 Tax=Sphingobacterium corticis TaxID=1812823 RepID=A0ABW5NF35_9SPHI
MPKTKEEEFWKACEASAANPDSQATLQSHIGNYQEVFQHSSARFRNLTNAKRKAHLIKWKAIENLDRYLVDFEANFTRAGGKVIWANDAAEALEELHKLLLSYQPDAVMSNHAMIHEEIGLPDYLAKSRYRDEQTDFGRHITALAGKKPTHVIQPAIDLDEEKAWALWTAKHPQPKASEQIIEQKADADDVESKSTEVIETVSDESKSFTAQMLEQFREIQRERVKLNSVLISGADYLTADSGSVVINESEGNERLHQAFCPHHIVFAGIDKILPSILDLDLFIPLGTLHDQGQHIQTYHTILSGGRKGRETDGPEQMVLILVDNGRSNLLAKTEQRQALYWMECGASSNACDIYGAVGGEAYQNVYPGPMGAVFAPHINKEDNFTFLDHAASFKNQDRPSPLDIDINRLLLKNRHDRIAESESANNPPRLWRWYSKLARNRKYLDFFGKGVKNMLIKFFFQKPWGEQRALPRVPDKSFSTQWRTKQKDND